MTTEQQDELGRWTTLEVLKLIFPIPRLATGIKRQVERELPFAIDAQRLDAWLEFERARGNADFIFDDQGSSKWWKLTDKGFLALERR